MSIHCQCGKGYLKFKSPEDRSERQISGFPALADFRDVHITGTSVYCTSCRQIMHEGTVNWKPDIDDLEQFRIALEKEHGSLLKNP